MTAPRLFALILAAASLSAEPPAPAVLSRTAQDVLIAIETNNLDSAASLAASLDDGVQQQLRDSLMRDAGKRVPELLSLLPSDTETMLVLREPFPVRAGELAPPGGGHLVQVCLTERLAALNNGRFFAVLNGRTIQFAAAGLSHIRPRAPGVMPDAEGAWLYLLNAPLGSEPFGNPSESIDGHPVWRMFLRSRGEESWLALARPDVLVMATSREILAGVLTRAAKPADPKAPPSTLPEWSKANAAASAFGLRHFTGDSPMTGLTFAWDAASQRVDVRTFQRTDPLPHPLDASVADALGLLGFGRYQ